MIFQPIYKALTLNMRGLLESEDEDVLATFI